MKTDYRAELDGLRAIAVVFVIFYHAQIKFNNSLIFKGGFIGLDILF
jgi:peptidoglycan/LPS O-acetylase OafA/YrhL